MQRVIKLIQNHLLKKQQIDDGDLDKKAYFNTISMNVRFFKINLKEKKKRQF